MKRNVEVITAEQDVLLWALDVMKKTSPRPKGISDLMLGLSDLIDGNCSSLTIEPGEGLPEKNEMLGTNQIVCGDLIIYTNTRRVVRDHAEISLTPKEYDILYLLAKNKGEVFTKEQIYQAVWDDVYLMDDSNIMSFIRKIRKKIERTPDNPQYILTIWGIGYKFNDAL